MKFMKENKFRIELAKLLKKYNANLVIDCYGESITLEFDIKNRSTGNFLIDTIEGNSINIDISNILKSIKK